MPRLPLNPVALLRGGAPALPTRGPIDPGSRAPARPRPPRRGVLRAVRALPPELWALLALAAVLDLWGLSRNGFANTYYSAAVRSMSTSWHAFLYGSFDASGIMTVDKPPMALWVQALAVRVFGFHSLSLLVPQALMGVGTVALAHDLTRRIWGRPAALAAGLVLALTPITVAISRHDNPDALLILCSTAALWALVRALQDGRTRWLVLAGTCVGLGFETKMAAALLVAPALAAAWLWVAPRGRRAALGQLAAGGAAMTAIGAAWPLLMLLTPAADRPWISGTADNSIVSLILDYNGLGRLDGQAGGPGALGGGVAGGVFGGATGPFRLLGASLGGQAGWLLGAAVVALVGIAVLTRLRRTDPRTGWILAAGGAWLTIAVAFSEAKGIFHPYYVSLLAPFTAVLVGAAAGVVTAGGRPARVLGPLAVLGGVATELVVLRDDATDLGGLAPVIVAGGVLAAAALAAPGSHRVRSVALAAGAAVLLAAPASWAAQTLGHATDGTFPAGGPASAGITGGRMGGPGGGGPGGGTRPAGARGQIGAPPGGLRGGGAAQAGGGMARGGIGAGEDLTAVLRSVAAHGGGTVAVSSQQGAATSIIASGASVVGIGGFSGSESAVTTGWLADQVAAGKIRWVVATSAGGSAFADGRTGATKAMAAVTASCTKVTVPGSTGTLYDCGGKAAAIRAAAS